MIFFGMASGSTKYATIESNSLSFETSTSYGKGFKVNNTSYDASVGAVVCFLGAIGLSGSTITLTFMYDINNAKVFAKTSKTGGTTSELKGVTISADKRTVSITPNINTSSKDIYLMLCVNGNFGTQYNYTLNLTNCTSNLTGGKIGDGSQTITLTRTGTNNLFYQTPYLVMGGVTHNFIISEDLKSSTITLPIDNNIEIYGTSEIKTLITYNGAIFNNCTCNYSDGEFYSPDKPITITANSGYQFVGEFAFNYAYLGYRGKFINEGKRLYCDKDLSTSISIELDDNYSATVTPVEPVEPVSAFTNLYLTTLDELALLSKERYQQMDNSTIDFGDYITNLYNTPFKVPLNIVGGSSNIVLGHFKTSVPSTLLTSSKFIIDMGTIKVTEKYNNVYDYSNVMYILHLPYFDKIYLDSEYVVNQTIKIIYVFDVYTGSATVNVYSSFIDSIIESRTNTVVSQIPFLQKQTHAAIGNITTVNKNDISSPFIEVVRNIPYNVDTIFGGETIEYGVIGDYTGFTRCENILLNSSATNTEKDEIIKLLNDGVIL